MSKPRKRAGEGHGEEGPSAERWLLTYSDMITLLMVLFIVLFALGQTDIRKFDAFKNSFHLLTNSQVTMPPGGPGVLSQPSAIALIESNPFARLNVAAANSASGPAQAGSQHSGAQPSGARQAGQSPSAAAEHQALLNAAARMQSALNKAGLANEVRFNLDQRGLVVSIMTDKILFPVDSASLQPEGFAILNAIGPVLAMLPNQIDVEGNTDNQPILGGPFRDNWELSAARAVAVVEYLIRDHRIDPARLQATGNSDTRPVVPNNSPAHQAENRRVALVVFSTTNNVTP
jgi:chemotaxis protein MotB